MSEKPDRKMRPSVSAHPAFPVIVALWFAALLGIGSLVLPTALFERYALASGLADAFAAAHPPLGATARLIIALGGAVVGAMLGLALARQVAAAHARRPAARSAAGQDADDNLAKRPISAHEELFEGGFDAGETASEHGETATRRSPSLAIGRESARSEFTNLAPLPTEGWGGDEDPLDLQVFNEAAAIAPSGSLPDAEPGDEGWVPTEQASALLDQSPSPSSLADVPSPEMAHTEDRAFAPEPAEPMADRAAAAPVSQRPLGELGMVELVERFAIALQHHRDAVRPAPEAVPSGAEFTPPAAALAVPAADDDAAGTALPSAPRPLEFDDESGEEEWEETAALPRLDPAGWGASETALDDESEDECATDYPSLLAMKSPLGVAREPVRLEGDDADSVDEPVLVFPGQMARAAMPASSDESQAHHPFDAALARADAAALAASRSGSRLASADHGETERALRDALEKLQRLSGAA